jgi:predicted Zn-dependent protease
MHPQTPTTSRPRFNWPGVLALVLAAALPLATSTAALAQKEAPREGVDVGEASRVKGLIPAGELEQQAAQQYQQVLAEARQKNALGGPDHPQVKRLRAIAQRIIPHALSWNPRAKDWKWEVNLIGSNQINAWCMPGGKIAFYTGILEQLKLTDDEVAMIMGHEMAHALREHARARIAKGQLTQGALAIGAQLLGLGDLGRMAAGAGAQLLTLKFSRGDESEADLVGMELAARAGYDPRAGVSLWQKMGQASKAGGGAPPQWLSTHPAGETRIRDIEANLPKVMPLYERARTQAR